MKIIHPMLAQDSTEVETIDGKVTVTSKYFNKPGRFGEIKYDGSRYIMQRDAEGKVHLTSRTISVKDNLPVEKTENLRGYLFDDNKDLADIIIDWEILIKHNGEFIKDNGSSHVNKVMLSKPEKAKELLSESGIELVYIVYDILSYRGIWLETTPLHERKIILKRAFDYIARYEKQEYTNRMSLSETIPHTQEQYDKLIASGFEGMMIKNSMSNYEQWDHSKNRMKVKKQITVDWFIIGGKEGTGKYKWTLWALIIWQFVDGNVKEVCTISGMDDNQRTTYWWYLKALMYQGGAFETEDGGIILSEDVLPIVVEFIVQEKTANKYRHPRFSQERPDKNYQDCVF